MVEDGEVEDRDWDRDSKNSTYGNSEDDSSSALAVFSLSWAVQTSIVCRSMITLPQDRERLQLVYAISA